MTLSPREIISIFIVYDSICWNFKILFILITALKLQFLALLPDLVI